MESPFTSKAFDIPNQDEPSWIQQIPHESVAAGKLNN